VTGPTLHPWAGIKLFTVTVESGRKVSLYEDWYQAHVIQRKVEIGWIADPIEEIKRALIRPVEIRPQHTPERYLYVGQTFTKGFCAGNCLHVAVQHTPGDRGVVFTVMLK
jgi:hypothetical protein